MEDPDSLVANDNKTEPGAARDRNVPLVSIELTGQGAHQRKTRGLLSLLTVNPVELYDRMRAAIDLRGQAYRDARAHYSAVGWEQALRQLANVIKPREEAGVLDQTSREVQKRLTENVPGALLRLYNRDPVLPRLGYLLTRALRPQVVIETGGTFGVVSSFILAALARNGAGRLISVGLPPLEVSPQAQAQIVGEQLRLRWKVIRGASTRVLRQVLKDLPPVGLFVHDGVFTQRNACREYELVLPHMASHSAILGNRVELSDAFARLMAQCKPDVGVTIAGEEKPGELIGACLFSDGPSFESGGKLQRPVMLEVEPKTESDE